MLQAALSDVAVGQNRFGIEFTTHFRFPILVVGLNRMLTTIWVLPPGHVKEPLVPRIDQDLPCGVRVRAESGTGKASFGGALGDGPRTSDTPADVWESFLERIHELTCR